MAAPCMSSRGAVSYRLLLQKQVLWKTAAAELQTNVRSQISGLSHTAVVTRKKNVAALKRETYTVDFIKKQIEEFSIGKRHLANMMGEDPETFTQEDIDKAIAYLFPSGLFEKEARPIMKHPELIFPKQRAIQWGEDGCPFHYLFYTGKQSYYSLMHDIYGMLLNLEKRQKETKTRDLIGSRWLIKEELEEMLVETLSDQDYMQFIHLLEKLLTLQYGAAEEEFVQRFRRSVIIQSKKQLIEPAQYEEQGMAFSKSEGKTKTAKAEAIVYERGSGRIKVNGIDYLHYFPIMQDREQLMFPFHFVDQLGKHDVTCRAGAVRLAMAKALCSFLTEDEVKWMRQAGLLTTDPCVREWKKPGQQGACRKFTWKKR
uniref:Small ribosomal subunit protein uS9m n=1 Tax=Cebus imitator TaxID=2715852 RepID=A0A2K5QXU8_CEBIM